jgi:hypothetical protein
MIVCSLIGNYFGIRADSFFDYENQNKNYTCYLIVNSVELEKYKHNLPNNLIEHKCTNISDDIIKE